jgi:ribosomal protein S18 acetylase RimI-like enzyme
MAEPTAADNAVIRTATSADDDFILGFVSRFSEFPLPAGRDRDTVSAGIRTDIERNLRERPPESHFFVIELDGERAGFVHLQLGRDFFGGDPTCHVSDLAIAPAFERRGLARRLLTHAEDFAREHACRRLTLSVFPGNRRARQLYEREGFSEDLMRLAKPLDH